MTYRVEILCADRETRGARDSKARCRSNDNATPCAEHDNIDSAAAEARTKARGAGWVRIQTGNHQRKGWLCPPCQDRRSG